MTAKKKSPPTEDADQSRRFLETARELEADGGLNPTDGERAFERLVSKALPGRGKPSQDPERG